ncbi:MAG: hypothetical protein IK099_08080 [Clostridia bacterium]|nr:hypothetical protein [Clostridia bacterium]
MKKLAVLLVLLVLALGSVFPAAASQAERLSDEQLVSYYKNAVFVGDSITAQLLVYVREQQQKDPHFFEGVKFLTAQSYSLYTASRKNLLSSAPNLKYRGQEMPMCAILQKIKPTRALILLGVNDYIGEQIQKGIGYDERIVDLAADFCPDTEIIFESLTPVTQAFCRKKDYRTLWDEYNAAMQEMCSQRGVGYVDIATRLKDADGYLDKAYSSDGKYHLNPKGLKLWIEALLDYAQGQYEQGLWTPEDNV